MTDNKRIQDGLSLALYQMINPADDPSPAKVEVDEARVRQKFFKTFDQVALPPRSKESTFYPETPQDTRTKEERLEDAREARFRRSFMKGFEDAMTSGSGSWTPIDTDGQ